MGPVKKKFTDSLIQLAIVLSLLRTDLNSLFSSGISTYPEVQEIMLGQTYAYTQTNFHSQNIYNTFEGLEHIHPKAVDNYFNNDFFHEIQQLSHHIQPHFNEDVISAWLVDGESYQPPSVGDTVAEPAPAEVNNNDLISSVSPAPIESATVDENQQSFETSNAILNPGSDLTKEDMDLIEVLWHQDIDLGIGRDGFDSNLRQELEKEKELEERKNQEQAQKAVENENDFNWENYIVDNETGELILADSEEAQLHTQVQNNYPSEGYSPLANNEESISLVDALEQLDTVTPPVVQTNTSLSTLLQTQDDQLDRELEDIINKVQQNDSQYGRQNSVEQRWSDITSLLNLTNSNNTMLPPVDTTVAPPMSIDMPPMDMEMEMETPIDSYTNNNGAISAYSSANSALIQNASFAPVSTSYALTQLIGTPTMPLLPPQVNNTSPGTFYNTNDTALFPDVTNIMNQTMQYIHSGMLTEMLDDELDNEIAGFGLESHVEHLNLQDISDDSAVSSMGSMSPHTHDWSDTLSTESGITSPFDGLEGATGGSYDGSSNSQTMVKEEKFEYSSSMDSYYLDDSDMEMNVSSNESVSYRPALHSHVQHNHTYPAQPGQLPKERKSDKKPDPNKINMSRDEKRLKSLKIPLTIADIVNSPVDSFNELLQKKNLNEDQMSVVRDIRRRGKNKVAAQNCRKRKMTVVVSLEDEIDMLKADREKAIKMRATMERELKNVRDKYDHMYQEMFRSLRDVNGHPYDPNEFSLQQTNEGNLALVPATNATQEQTSRPRVVKKRKSNKKN